MTPDPVDQAGFAPRNHTRVRRHRSRIVAQFVTSVALVLSIAIAATAVTIGIAHAVGVAFCTAKPAK